MTILHLLVSGGYGGIEKLINDYANYTKLDSIYFFAWGGGIFTDEMITKGKRVFVRHIRNEGALRVIRHIFRLCQEQCVDIVVIHLAAPLLMIAGILLKLRFPSIKIICYAHNNAHNIVPSNLHWLRREVKKLIIRTSFQRADKVVAISKSVKNSLVEYFGVKSEQIQIVYNGVDVNVFRKPTEKLTGRLDNISIIYIGRLIKEKGVQTIVKAIYLLPAAYQLTIVGEGPYRKALEEMCGGIDNKVKFLGERRNIPELLNQADIFVHMPEWEEGFGITVIEAMAAGKICIVDNAGAMPELITNGVNGFIVEKGNAKELAKKIKEVAEKINTKEMNALRDNAILRARDFSIEKFSDNLDSIIIECTE